MHITFLHGQKKYIPLKDTIGTMLTSKEAQEAAEGFLNSNYPNWKMQLEALL